MLERAALPSVIRGGGWHITMETAALSVLTDMGVGFSVNSEGGELKASIHT